MKATHIGYAMLLNEQVLPPDEVSEKLMAILQENLDAEPDFGVAKLKQNGLLDDPLFQELATFAQRHIPQVPIAPSVYITILTISQGNGHMCLLFLAVLRAMWEEEKKPINSAMLLAKFPHGFPKKETCVHLANIIDLLDAKSWI